MNVIKPIKIDNLFDAVGMSAKGTIGLNENTYDFDLENPKNNWLYGALLGFLELRKQEFIPEGFATIGTGSGLDSIGAYEVFHCSEIFQTDVHPNVIETAQNNVANHVKDNAQVETLLGDLCNPLIERRIQVDLLYANIPNLPSDTPVLAGKKSASRFEPYSDECPEVFITWLLALQYKFLTQAKKVLKPDGVILLALGDRVPQIILDQLFTDTGYKFRELVNMYKIQTEPEEIITGYAEQESRHNITFDFYEHEKVLPLWQKECEGRNLSVENIKVILMPFRLSANEALGLFKEGKSVGHVYSIFMISI